MHVLFGTLLGEYPPEPELTVEPYPEFRGVHHFPERYFLVLQLVAFLPGFTPGTGRRVNDPDPGGYLVHVLPAVAAAPESLHFTVVNGDGEERDLIWFSRYGDGFLFHRRIILSGRGRRGIRNPRR